MVLALSHKHLVRGEVHSLKQNKSNLFCEDGAVSQMAKFWVGIAACGDSSQGFQFNLKCFFSSSVLSSSD